MTDELQRLRRTSNRARTALEQRDELVREATEAGRTRREVAEAAGLSVGAVQQILRRVGGLTVLLFVVLTASASAHLSAGYPTMVRIALHTFPEAQTRCPEVTVDSSHTLWTPATGPAAQVAEPCTLLLGPEELFHRAGRGTRRSNLVAECGFVVHEHGHLAGYAHNSDPNSIMYELGPIQPLPTCRAAFSVRWVRAHHQRPDHLGN